MHTACGILPSEQMKAPIRTHISIIAKHNVSGKQYKHRHTASHYERTVILSAAKNLIPHFAFNRSFVTLRMTKEE